MLLPVCKRPLTLKLCSSESPGAQVCWTQLPEWKDHITDNLIIVPYASTVNVKLPRRKRIGLKDILIFYKGGCSNDTERSAGQKMRAVVVKQLGNAARDVVVECACR